MKNLFVGNLPHSTTEDELRRLIDISRESGHLRAEERRLIHRVFEFSDTLVREAMVLNKGFGDRFKVRFEARSELSPREVTADHKRLLQVMTNLLSNAAKFSAEGQVVEISTEERSDCLVLRAAIPDGASLNPSRLYAHTSYWRAARKTRKRPMFARCCWNLSLLPGPISARARRTSIAR